MDMEESAIGDLRERARTFQFICKLCELPGVDCMATRELPGISTGDLFHSDCAEQVCIPDEHLRWPGRRPIPAVARLEGFIRGSRHFDTPSKITS